MSSFASPKVWEEPTEVTHEGGNAFENLLVPRKSAFFHGFFGRKSPNPCLFLQIQDAGPVSGNPPGAVIGQEKQHLEESN